MSKLIRDDDQYGMEGSNFLVMLKKPGFSHQIEMPKGQKGETIIRLFPEFDEHGNEVPFMLDAKQKVLGSWFWSEKIFYGGVRKTILIFSRLAGSERAVAGPVEVFSTELHNRLENDPHSLPADLYRQWEDLSCVKKRMSKIPDMRNRKAKYGLFQGILYRNGGKDLRTKTGEPYYPVLLVTSRSVYNNLAELCTTPSKAWVDSGSPINAPLPDKFACGDFISCAGGKLLTISLQKSIGNKGMEISEYVITPTQPLPLDSAFASSMWVPWDKLLEFHTVEQQIDALLIAHDPEMLDYAFAHTPYYDRLPANVRGSLAVLVSNPMRSFAQAGPVASAMASQYGQPQGPQGYAQPQQPPYHTQPVAYPPQPPVQFAQPPAQQSWVGHPAPAQPAPQPSRIPPAAFGAPSAPPAPPAQPVQGQFAFKYGTQVASPQPLPQQLPPSQPMVPYASIGGGGVPAQQVPFTPTEPPVGAGSYQPVSLQGEQAAANDLKGLLYQRLRETGQSGAPASQPSA